MSEQHDATIAARVPLDVRHEVEARVDELRRLGVHYPDGREADISMVVRRALRRELDLPAGATLVNMGGVTGGSLDGTPRSPAPGRPRSHARGPETERQAARAAWPYAETQRRKALELVARATPATRYSLGLRLSTVGMTGDELDRELGGYNGRRRLSDLKAGGWAERLIVDGEPVRRKTRTGALADVYVLTAAARRELDREARLAA